MKKTVLLNLVLIAVLLLAVPQARGVSAVDVTRHYLILARGQGAGSTDFLSAVVKAKGTVTHVFEAVGVVTADSANPNFIATLRAQKGSAKVQAVVEDVEVNWLPNEQVVQDASIDISPLGAGLLSEPRGALQWNLTQIHADQTADNGDLGEGARVAVLDSGIVTTHPDIAPNLNLTLSISFVPGEGVNPPAGTTFNHGTHVAGIIAAPINGMGIQGVAPEAEIVAVKVLSAAGSGAFSWVIEGILYASGPDVNADVINMSLGATFDRINAGGGGAGTLISALNRAITYATQQGTLVVSAAGNDGMNLNSRLWSIPAQSGNGMAVSATGPIGFAVSGYDVIYDRLASYSNYGQSVINVAAPGGDDVYPGSEDCTVATVPLPITRPCWVFDMVFSPSGYNGLGAFYYSWADGTSMAAPHVSGLAALIVGKYGHMPPAQLQALIEQSADDILKPGTDEETGHGRINALTALGGE